VEESVLEEAAQEEVEEDDAPPVLQALRRLRRAGLVGREALLVLGRQDPPGGRLLDDPRDDDRGDAGVELRHPAHPLGFVQVVELLPQAGPELLPDRLEVDLGDERDDRLQDPSEVAEVGLDHPVDPRVLDLHGDLPAVAEDGPVDLADRGGRERLGLEAREELQRVAELLGELIFDHLEREARRLLLERPEDRRDLGREQRVLEAEHLPHLHRGPLHLAERRDEPTGVPDELLELQGLPRRRRTPEARDERRRGRGPGANGQSAQLEEPAREEVFGGTAGHRSRV
jgi:hypothetical protein